MTQTQQTSQPAQPNRQESKLVPVGESIKYRKRAQQAEARAQQLEQQLQDLRQQLTARQEQLAGAEAQRDEAQVQLTVAENRLAAQRALSDSGVVDLETASLLLSKRLDLSEPIEPQDLSSAVEQLLLDKPFLRAAPGGSLPPKTASARSGSGTSAAQLAEAADRAIRTGDRRDVAEYLRLRRQSGTY